MFAYQFGSYGWGPGELGYPAGVAFGPGGIIAVADYGNYRVQVFHANGTYAFEFGSYGQGPGDFGLPLGVAFGPGGIIAVAGGNYRVHSHAEKFLQCMPRASGV